MSENRDTQFKGFAKQVVQELMRSNAADKVDVGRFWDEENIAEVELLLARRAYDLACHVVAHLDEDVAWRKGKGYYIINRIVENDVPDLTEWPKESE